MVTHDPDDEYVDLQLRRDPGEDFAEILAARENFLHEGPTPLPDEDAFEEYWGSPAPRLLAPGWYRRANVAPPTVPRDPSAEDLGASFMLMYPLIAGVTLIGILAWWLMKTLGLLK